MKQNTWSSVFSADVLEFATLAIQYCSFVEQPIEDTPANSVQNIQKLLTSLYLKSLSVASLQLECDDEVEDYVTEEQYNEVRAQIARLFGSNDDYLDVFVEDMKYSDKPILKTISEDMADIYQALGNFASLYNTGIEEVMFAALAEVMVFFKEYWGGRLLSALRAIHEVKWKMETEEDY